MQNAASLSFLMMFVSFFFISSKLAKFRKATPFSGLLAAIPFVIFYALPPALQDSVGVDFESYRRIYEDQLLTLYWKKREFGFVGSVQLLHYLGFSFRGFLIFIYAILALNLFIFISRCGREGANTVLLTFLIFSVSGIYFNQMNILRQILALSFFLAAIALSDRKSLALPFIFLMASFHTASIVLVPIYYIAVKVPKWHATLFYTGFIFWVIVVPLFVKILITTFFPFYDYYFSYDKGGALINIATKIYWLPAYLLFISFRRVRLSSHLLSSKFGENLSAFSMITYWCFFAAILFPSLDRLNHFFTIFYIVPIYAVLIYLSKKGPLHLFLGLAYVSIPIMIKLFLLPAKEYLYISIIL